MKRLVLVNSIPQFRELQKSRGELLDTHTPVTCDMAVAALFEDERRTFVELWDYLSDEELESNWETAWTLSHQWHGIADDQFECFGAYPLRSSGIEMLMAFETAINANLAFGRLFDAHTPTEVVGSADEFPIYRSGPVPIYRGTATVAEGIARWQCDQRGISFVTSMAAPQLTSTRRLPLRYQRVPSTTTGPVPDNSSAKPLLLIVDVGQNPRELFALESQLQHLDRFRVIRVSELNRPPYPLAIPLPASVRDGLHKARARSNEMRARYQGPYPHIFANRHLNFQFDGVWEEVRRSCETSAFFEPLFRLVRPDAVLLGADCFTTEGVIRDMAMKRGIMVGVLLHSGLCVRRAWRELKSSGDVVFTWGQVDSNSLVDQGSQPPQMSIVGSLRYHGSPNFSGNVTAFDGAQIRGRLSIPDGPVVSVLTGTTNIGLALSSCEPRIHRASLRALIRWAEEHPAVTLVIKPHPSYDQLEWYRYASAHFPRNVRLVEGQPLDQILAITDVAVLLNYCTTAALEALRVAPIVYARIGYRETPLMRSPLDDAVLGARSVSELTSHIDALLDKANPLREQCFARQRVFFDTAFSRDAAKHPGERIADVVQDRLRDRATPGHSGDGLEQQQVAWLSQVWNGDLSLSARHWADLVSAAHDVDVAGFLLATAIAIGASRSGPLQVRSAVAILRGVLAGRNAPLASKFLSALCVTGMTRGLNAHRWDHTMALASEAIRCAALDPKTLRLIVRIWGRAAVSSGVADLPSLLAISRTTFFGSPA